MSQEGSNRHWSDSELSILRERFPTESAEKISQHIDRSEQAIKHKSRRLGISKQDNYTALKKMREVDTPEFDNLQFNNFIAGFTAGEGCFTYRNATNKSGKRFAFQIALAESDSDILYKIKDYLEVGNIYHHPPRDENWEGGVQYQVQSIGEIASVIIPFFDSVDMYNTTKVNQYNEWREEFLEYNNITERFK